MLLSFEGNMARLFDRSVASVTMLVVLGTAVTAEAQELRKDIVSNGALIGALSGVGIVLVESWFRCGTPPDKVQCTGKGMLLSAYRAAIWAALVGLIVDAAIPSKLEGPARASPMQSQRTFGVRFAVRF